MARFSDNIPFFKKTEGLCFVIWVFSLALYLPSLKAGFVNYDDVSIVLNQPNLYNENSFLSSLKQIFFEHFPREEPLLLRDVTWAVDSYLFGFYNPLGYHLGNVLLNSFNVVLLFLFLHYTRKETGFAFLAAGIFSLLAVHVEAVTWIMGRKDMLVSFFMLSGLIVQTFFLRSTEPAVRRRLYFLTILITLFALLSKISALTYFLVLGLHQIFFPFLTGESPPNGKINFFQAVSKTLPRMLPHVLISIFIHHWYSSIIGDFGIFDRGVDSLSLYHLKNLLIFTPLIFMLYLKLLFIPLNYSYHYAWPNIHDPLKIYHMVGSACAVVFMLWVMIVFYRRRKDLLFFLLTFFIIMIPYLNIIYIGIWYANRYIYLSSFCIVVITVNLLIKVSEKKTGMMAVWVVLLTALGSVQGERTLFYQKVWQNEHSFWTYQSSLPDAPFGAFSSLSFSFLTLAQHTEDAAEREKLLDQAEEVFQKGVKKYETLDSYAAARDALALHDLYFVRILISEFRGDPMPVQLKHAEKACEIWPQSPRANKKLSEIYRALALENRGNIREFAERSLYFFKNYLDSVSNDPRKHRADLRTLKMDYEKNFPFLAEKIRQLEKMIHIKLENGVKN
jgi:hypothetical protein